MNVSDKKHWEKPNKVISSDIKGYYGYLPALFINDDIQLQDLKPYQHDGDLKLWFSTDDQGRRYIKFPAGMAILYSPFFTIAHATAGGPDAPANGYSEPYRFWLLIGGLFYTFLGIIFFSKLMLRHFSDRASATTLLVLYLGTNLYYYTAFDGVFTHGHTFFLFSAFMYGCVLWLDTKKWKYVFLLGITGGLMVAVRHVDVWFLLFIILYGIRSFKDFKERFVLFWEHRWKVLVGGLLLALMMAPQFLYHWYIFGDFFHYAYDDERFFFTAPHLYDALFSYRNGWLIYSPIMIFSVIGLLLLRKRLPELLTISIIGLPVYYYVLASWWCWWFVGFGNRAYINMYPLLAFSFAALVSYLYEKYRVAWGVLNLAIIGSIVLNAFQSEQFNLGILHWDSETKEHYWHVFGRSERSQTQDVLLQTPNNPAAKKDIDSVYSLSFNTLSRQQFRFNRDFEKHTNFKGHVSPRHGFQSTYGLFVPVNNEFAAQIPVEVHPKTTHIYISAWFKGDDEYRIVLDATGQETPFNVIANEVIEERGEWKKIQLMTAVPKEAAFTHLLFYVWNQNKKPFAMDNLRVDCLTGGYQQLLLD
ncbi:MAG: hypothetical protein Crog4KO_19610 [Crocinitomicaceae bacterium]